jgi:Photoprotection regulator fluorescence recovery protein
MTPPATQGTYPYPNEPTWSRSEKAIARRLFDAALKRELQEAMQKAKQMANQISKPADLWDLERYLTQRRKDINSKYDFRSSRLTSVFGRPCANGESMRTSYAAYARTKLKRSDLAPNSDLRMQPDRILSAMAVFDS